MMLSAPAMAASNDEALQQLRTRIDHLETSINRLKRDRSESYVTLVALERKLGSMHQQIRQLDRQLNKLERAIQKNRDAREKLQSGLGKQQQSVAEHLRTAYLLGSQAQLKLLLNQERITDVSRAMSYYRYLTQARLNRIDTMNTNLSKQRRLAGEISQQKNRLALLKQRKLEEKSRIDELANERKQLLASLDQRLNSSGSRMRQLREDERRLEQLVNRIQGMNEPGLTPGSTTGPFAKQKKKLRLPVQGRILANFGARRNTGDQRWNGIFISTNEGQNIRSVYAGRVVFAGWLHGFGLLMILDHGDGYMTLYGHNRSLYKVVGDWVETGDIIASAGDTGSPPRTGLYFGVRQQGKPRNPLIWCKISRQ